jgi:apolipoprotein N-acyltransferase
MAGLAWGAGFFLCGVSWVYVSLSNSAAWPRPPPPPPRWPSASTWRCFRHWPATCIAVAAARTPRHRCQPPLLFAGLWTLAEWLRGTLFTGFPWLAIGYSQSPPSPLAGWASVLGVYGVGFIVA